LQRLVSTATILARVDDFAADLDAVALKEPLSFRATVSTLAVVKPIDLVRHVDDSPFDYLMAAPRLD